MKPIQNTHSDYACIAKDDLVHVYGGTTHQLKNLEEVETLQQETKNKIIFLLPFWVVQQYNHEAHGDEPILALEVEKYICYNREKLSAYLPEKNLGISKKITPNISDSDFAKLVEQAQQEIHHWNVCQLILSRLFEGKFDSNFWAEEIRTLYKKLLAIQGGYMTYLFKTGNHLFAGASPEVHLSIQDNILTKHPIAWTLLEKSEKTFFENLHSFLQDHKEIQELLMVTDEELKMMFKVSTGGQIENVNLRKIAHLLHTEKKITAFLKDNTRLLEALQHTLHSPTLVGWPLASAFSLIKKYEPESRRYYGSAFGEYDGSSLDSCITIRSAEINLDDSTFWVRAGAWIVHDSQPELETKETQAKANGFLNFLQNSPDEIPVSSQEKYEALNTREKNIIEEILQKREIDVNQFYLRDNTNTRPHPEILWKTCLLVDNGDGFIHMLAYMLEVMWAKVDIVPYADMMRRCAEEDMGFDIVLLWPWPWDINDTSCERMKKIRDNAEFLALFKQKTLGICLGHQAICWEKHIPIKQQKIITQWEQKELHLFDKKEKLGFYNSFSPEVWKNYTPVASDVVEDGRLLYQQSDHTVSCQFHPESIMSVNGFEILKKMVLEVL